MKSQTKEESDRLLSDIEKQNLLDECEELLTLLTFNSSKEEEGIC